MTSTRNIPCRAIPIKSPSFKIVEIFSVHQGHGPSYDHFLGQVQLSFVVLIIYVLFVMSFSTIFTLYMVFTLYPFVFTLKPFPRCFGCCYETPPEIITKQHNFPLLYSISYIHQTIPVDRGSGHWVLGI